MNFALAYIEKEVPQVQRWLDWVSEIGGLGQHRLFLMPIKGLVPSFRTNIPFTVVKDEEGRTTDWAEDSKSVIRDAAGPNSMLRQFAWYFHPLGRQNLGPIWMFIEADCIPLRPGWADELEVEYRGCGKPFMAAFVKGKEGLFPDHPTGNMIMPELAAEMSKGLMLPQYVRIEGGDGRQVEYAFDVACAADVLPRCHFTKKLQHVFRGPKFETMADLARIDPAACLWHTDKDGGLINLLRRQKNGEADPIVEAMQRPIIINPPAIEVTKPKVHTYFRPCVDPEALAEQKRILAIWEKNWREHGWEPVILTEAHAKKYPDFEVLEAALRKLPTVSPKEYEMASFLRHVAMATLGEGNHLLVDYDCLVNGFSFVDVEMFANENARYPKILSDNNPVPCAVLGTTRQYEVAVHAFLTCPPGEEQGQPHLSDMLAVQKLKFPAKDVCREFGTNGWEKAPLIHFCHRSCGKKWRSTWMSDWIDGNRIADTPERERLHFGAELCDTPNPEWVNSDAPVIEHNLGCKLKRPIMEEIRERLVWIKDNSRGITRHHVHRELKALGLLPKK